MNKKYDFIFSIGEACSCTQALRNNFLQIASFPFDWLFGSNFIGRCKILTQEFERFIEKDDLEYSYEERSISCQAYHNKFNDITFNHDFKKDMPFEDAYKEVFEKYQRRIKRLFDEIQNAKSVLIVYIESPLTNHINIENSEITEGFNILKNKFGDKINLLYVKYTKDKYTTEELQPKLTKIEWDYKDYDGEQDHMVIMKKLQKAISGFELKKTAQYKLQHFVMKNLIKLIPHKSTRHKLRKKYHI